VDDRESTDLLRFANGLLDESDAVLVRQFGGAIASRTKADATLVTAADIEIEERLRTRIADAFPDHGFVGEELGAERGGGDAHWIVDPIDGTHNFVRGIPVVATLLAFERGSELVLGVVSAPLLGVRWSAAVGAGSAMRSGGRERPIRVSAIRRVEEAQLCTSGLRSLGKAGLLPAWQRLTQRSWRDRGFGDFWGHLLVAQGSAEVMLEDGLKPWDLAAASIIVTEAGGLMTDLTGQPSWNGPSALTSNGFLHDEILAALRQEQSSAD
jgi:histidinol-phosphatase